MQSDFTCLFVLLQYIAQLISYLFWVLALKSFACSVTIEDVVLAKLIWSAEHDRAVINCLAEAAFVYVLVTDFLLLLGCKTLSVNYLFCLFVNKKKFLAVLFSHSRTKTALVVITVVDNSSIIFNTWIKNSDLLVFAGLSRSRHSLISSFTCS